MDKRARNGLVSEGRSVTLNKSRKGKLERESETERKKQTEKEAERQ